MNARVLSSLITPLVLALLLASTSQCWAGADRLALVIGNAAYPREPLANTRNDARDMAVELQRLGFTVNRHEDLNHKDFSRAVNDFLRRVSGTDAVALVYYAGHGVQRAGQNYLVPVDADIKDELDIPHQAISLDEVLAGLGERGKQAVNLVILDACRNNPYGSGQHRSIGSRGLARVQVGARGTLILYATQPGSTASDNPGGLNGLFTKHLLDAMRQPGLQVEEVFKQVARSVSQDSEDRQWPWSEGQILGEFYFIPPKPQATIPAPAPSPPASVPAAPPPLAMVGQIQVNVNTAARVEIDGRALGEAGPGRPLNLEGISVGPRQVRATAIGFRDQAQRVDVSQGQWTQVALVLTPQPPPVAAPALIVQPPPDLRVEEALGLSAGRRYQVQAWLVGLGRDPGKLDGAFGSATRSAIEAWQMASGLPKSGYLDADQLARLSRSVDASQAEQIYWNAIRSTSNVAVLTDFAALYPNGRYTGDARARVNALQQGATVARQPTPEVRRVQPPSQGKPPESLKRPPPPSAEKHGRAPSGPSKYTPEQLRAIQRFNDI